LVNPAAAPSADHAICCCGSLGNYVVNVRGDAMEEAQSARKRSWLPGECRLHVAQRWLKKAAN
jgi:hypothetical protein